MIVAVMLCALWGVLGLFYHRPIGGFLSEQLHSSGLPLPHFDAEARANRRSYWGSLFGWSFAILAIGLFWIGGFAYIQCLVGTVMASWSAVMYCLILSRAAVQSWSRLVNDERYVVHLDSELLRQLEQPDIDSNERVRLYRERERQWVEAAIPVAEEWMPELEIRACELKGAAEARLLVARAEREFCWLDERHWTGRRPAPKPRLAGLIDRYQRLKSQLNAVIEAEVAKNTANARAIFEAEQTIHPPDAT